jgi:hypothetical protein
VGAAVRFGGQVEARAEAMRRLAALSALPVAAILLILASLVGFVTLLGIATRNGILRVAHYRQLLGEAVPFREAVVRGMIGRVMGGGRADDAGPRGRRRLPGRGAPLTRSAPHGAVGRGGSRPSAPTCAITASAATAAGASAGNGSRDDAART